VKERWIPIHNYAGIYEVSNAGKIRSIDRVVVYRTGKVKPLVGVVLKTCPDPDGYPTVTLCKHNKRRTVRIHIIVASAFIPKPKGKTEVNHKDCDKQNNQASNLEWVNDQEQSRHAWANGRCPYPKGSKHGMSKLTEAEVSEIKRRLRNGERQKDIADDYKVWDTLISRINTGKRWGHVN
jgi:hypothetical protein